MGTSASQAADRLARLEGEVLSSKAALAAAVAEGEQGRAAAATAAASAAAALADQRAAVEALNQRLAALAKDLEAERYVVGCPPPPPSQLTLPPLCPLPCRIATPACTCRRATGAEAALACALRLASYLCVALSCAWVSPPPPPTYTVWPVVGWASVTAPAGNTVSGCSHRRRRRPASCPRS
jgi:hypothetical protein